MKRLVVSACGTVCLFGVLGAAWASNPTPPPVSPIDQDERAVYEAVLASWLGNEQRRQLVNMRLGTAPSTTDPELEKCTTDAVFLPASQQSLPEKSLDGVRFDRSGIEVIDGSQWQPFDRDKSLAQGNSIEDALEESFAYALISFSEIVFSRDRQDALVNFQMACGRLCGHGSTMRLHKADGRWAVAHRCASYMS